MSGYTAEERLRQEQLRVLRRRWLKDQELSPREPLLPPEKPGPVAAFWQRFLQPRSLWRIYTFKTYSVGVFTLTRVLIPAWIIHYCLKYHVMNTPYGIVGQKLRIFPGDHIIETGEVIPPMKEDSHGHH